MDREQLERGLKIRREVLGDEYVDRAMNNVDDFNSDFQDILNDYCWGGTWGRGVLSKQQRSILNLGMLAALNRGPEFKLHFRGAIKNGVSLEELKDVLYQIAIYCGIPAGGEAHRIANEVLAEEGVAAE
ncbi:MAG: carboxymuconolactone decarboxylase family protein [Alphaproteobacteria bacterium]|nr:carboxymuconolactone decarboxylase family protein [Alphaproteobacteria bacterium]